MVHSARAPKLKSGFVRQFQSFFQLEAASGIVLLVCTLVALACANSSFQKSYHDLWNGSVAGLTLHHWINDGLMTIFFLVVGLEIKREFLYGELSSRQRAALPVAAAFGGMIVPALVYSFLNQGTPGASGWGIPMATDIAFAIGVLALLGSRVPPSLRVFLTALAIVDDLGAVLVIALFYSTKIYWSNLAAGVGIFGVLYALNRKGVLSPFAYLGLGVLAWFAFFKSGIHSTLAGVLLAFVIPLHTGARLEQRLHPWVSFGVVPVFALSNAGVTFSGGTLFHPISLGVIAGLVMGKQIGITFFSWLSVRLKVAILPEKVSWAKLYGLSWLGGIGFTMSLFMTQLAFAEAQMIEIAKLGILAGSILSGCIGIFLCLMLFKIDNEL